MLPTTKKIVILGGGTNTYISNHLALSAPAYGTTAIQLEDKFKNHSENKMQVDLYLTKMADQGSKRKSIQDSIKFREESLRTKNHSDNSKRIITESIVALKKELEKYSVLDTPDDVSILVDKLIADPDTRVIIFNVAMVDYKPEWLYTQEEDAYEIRQQSVTSSFGKYAKRLNTSALPNPHLELTVQDKIIQKIRKERKDILLVGFKTTCGATKEEQFHRGLKLCKDASANIVFVNDVDKERILNLRHALESKTKLSSMESESEMRAVYIADGIKEAEEQIEALQNNGLVTPEESSYWYNTRDEALDGLVQMVLDRSHLHFTRSTVVDSETVSWFLGYEQEVGTIFNKGVPYAKVKGKKQSIPNPIIPETFRTIFDWVRSQGAYKKGPTGATVGHFGIKLGPNEFLTSKRKTDFNKIEEVGLVRVITDDPDNVFGYKHFFMTPEEKEFEYWKDCFKIPNFEMQAMPPLQLMDKEHSDWNTESFSLNDKVIAFGAKPSVGGQSQRSLFNTFPDLDCIVHFHCPLKVSSRDLFNATPQFSYECGSKECIASNITGFKEYKVSEAHSIWAGHMIQHGPNIVFSKSINPQLVIDFIDTHWDLTRKTDGLSQENR